MKSGLFKTLFISFACVGGATIIIVPTALALTNKTEVVYKKVMLNNFANSNIYSEYTAIEAKDKYIDFEIDLSLLKTHEVSFPRNFLKVETQQQQPLVLVDLENVYLNGEEVEPLCYTQYNGGIKFTRPIFDINIDTKLAGRIIVGDPARQAGEYHFIWTHD